MSATGGGKSFRSPKHGLQWFTTESGETIMTLKFFAVCNKHWNVFDTGWQSEAGNVSELSKKYLKYVFLVQCKYCGIAHEFLLKDFFVVTVPDGRRTAEKRPLWPNRKTGS